MNPKGLIYVICTTTTYMKTMRKLAILESLDAMDHVQMEKVLTYIKEVLKQEQATDSRRFRQQAMEQIRLALRSDKSSRVSV
ncbi:MAG: hypothetical protein HOP08_09255 [Cyclobacteriaceae bacterium]|nr:hypothetical protein [Cyclobacteriaceae bacterium]